jgi:hypothetical protein
MAASVGALVVGAGTSRSQAIRRVTREVVGAPILALSAEAGYARAMRATPRAS